MITKMYSIYDIKTQLYHPPHFCHNEEHAKRLLQTLFNQDNVFSEYPDDFRIYEVGDFNDSTAELIPIAVPKLITEGKNLKRSSNVHERIT